MLMTLPLYDCCLVGGEQGGEGAKKRQKKVPDIAPPEEKKEVPAGLRLLGKVSQSHGAPWRDGAIRRWHLTSVLLPYVALLPGLHVSDPQAVCVSGLGLPGQVVVLVVVRTNVLFETRAGLSDWLAPSRWRSPYIVCDVRASRERPR